jgi:ubiquitin carboxyl-terminal hydrolase 10
MAGDDEVVMPLSLDQHETAPETAEMPAPIGGRPSESLSAILPPTPAPTAAGIMPAPRSETPSTQDLPSEDAPSTSPTTPGSVQPTQTATAASVTPTSASRPASRPAVPAVPIIPAIPKAAPRSTDAEKAQIDERQNATPEATPATTTEVNGSATPAAEEAKAESQQAPQLKPKLWTGLFSTPAPTAVPKASTGLNGAEAAAIPPTDTAATPEATGAGGDAVPSFKRSNTNSVAEALQAYRVGPGEKLAFIEPRGLINTGNMCYMNSVSIAWPFVSDQPLNS